MASVSFTDKLEEKSLPEALPPSGETHSCVLLTQNLITFLIQSVIQLQHESGNYALHGVWVINLTAET